MIYYNRLWPSGDCFVFNCYFHWSSLVFQNSNGTAIFLHSREGITQGDPLAIIAFSISIIPFIKNLKRYIPNFTELWYANNAGELGTFAIIGTYFNSLTRQRSDRGYHTEPSKSVLILHPDNLSPEKSSKSVTDLRWAWARVISGVTLGTTSPRAIC